MNKNWQTKKLGDLCRIRTGKKDVNEGNPDGKFPFFTCAAEHTFSDNYSFDTEALLIAGNGDVGKVSYYNGKFEAYQRTYVLSDFSEVLPRFLYLILDGKLKDTVSKQKLGNTMPYIKVGMLTNFTFPLPPLPEQHRIVAILDKAFEAIATAKANSEKNLKNSQKLFKSYLNQIFTQRGEGWNEKCLGEMATLRNGINFTKSSKGDPVKILGVKDFQNNYWAPIDDLDSIVPDGDVPDTDTIQKNDLVFVRSNGNPELIGRCLLIPETHERATHSGFTIKARLNTPDVVPTFLCHFLKSSLVRRKMIDGGNGVNIKSLNQGTLSRLRIPFPSQTTQVDIVGRFEVLQSETQRLSSVYQQKLAALDELKKSILHKAFSGELSS